MIRYSRIFHRNNKPLFKYFQYLNHFYIFLSNFNVNVLLAIDRGSSRPVDRGSRKQFKQGKATGINASTDYQKITLPIACRWIETLRSQSFDRSDDRARPLPFRFLSIYPRMIMVNRRGRVEICYYNHILERRIARVASNAATNRADFSSSNSSFQPSFSPDSIRIRYVPFLSSFILSDLSYYNSILSYYNIYSNNFRKIQH